MSDFPTSNSAARKVPKSTIGGFVIALIVVMLWSLSTALRRLSASVPGAGIDPPSALIAQDIGYAVGSGLFIGGVTSLILFFTHVKARAPERGTKHFLILWGTASAVAVLPILLGLAVMATDPARSQAVTAILEDGRADAAALKDAQSAEQARILAGDPFSGRALARPGGVATARAKLAELRRSVASTQEQAQRDADSIRANLTALPMSEANRAKLLADYDRGFAAGRADSRPSQEAVAAVFAAVEGQLDVLSRTPRGWVAEGGELAFTSQRDVDDFNAHARELDAAQARARAALSKLDEANGAEAPQTTP